MKKLIILLGVVLLFGCCHEKDDEFHMTVWSMATHIPIDDYYRKIIGYDSIQLIIQEGKLEANFCYPNEWEKIKLKKDTIFCLTHDTIYTSKHYNHVDKVIIGGN